MEAALTRLPYEWQRLYLLQAQPEAQSHVREGQVRAMVLTLASPTDWTALSAVWQAVQAELGWPAPAIAVNGIDGYQLWFSLAQPVPAPQAHACLDALRQRHLSHIAPARIGLWPAALPLESDEASKADEADEVAQVGTAAQPTWPADLAPATQVRPDQWSAFLAPDLAPMFAETPWLDIPPSPEGQADLLSRLACIQPAAWQAALAQLMPAQADTSPPASTPAAASTHEGPTAHGLDPRHFLHSVMNDTTVALALRIDAAKALLLSPVASQQAPAELADQGGAQHQPR